MCVLLDCCLCLNTAWQLDYLITWLLWCGAWSVFQCCLATIMLPCYHAAMLPYYYASMLLVNKIHLNAARQRLFVIQVPTALVTSHTVKQGWEKMTQGWEKAKISHKFSTPSWKATILAKWSRPSAIVCSTFNANTITAWTKHNTLTVLPILQLQVFHYWGKTSWHCLFDFSADDCDLMQLVSQHKYKYCLDQYNTLTVPFILLLQVLHRSKTSWHGLCDFSTDDCDLMHFVSPSSQHLTCKKI